MHGENHYSRVEDLISKEDFHRAVEGLDREFGGLLERDVLEYIVVDEIGRNRSFITPISELRAGKSCTIFGKVMEKTKGKKGQFILSDNTSSCWLTLGDSQLDVFDRVEVGDILKVINGFAREYNGWMEVNVGRWSHIEINPEDAPSIDIKPVTGKVIDIGDTEVVFNDDGDVLFSRRVMLRTDSRTIPVTIWNEHIKSFKNFKRGDIMTIIEPVKRVKGKRLVEVEARSISRIFRSRG